MSSPAAAPLPVGFRFRPTDEELVRHYLKPKIAGRAHPDLLLIPDVDLSACEPWDLPAKALIKSDDPEWFFFAPLDRKYPGGHRSNRSTAAGYWKATGKDRLIRSRPQGALIGIKKTLVFHRGRAPRGHRTAWIMHEYRTAEPHLQQGQNGSFVLYRLFNKHEEGSNSEDTSSDSPPTSSPQNSPVVKAENSPLSQPASTKRAHLPATATNNESTATQAQGDPLLDVFAQLPDPQPEQKHDGFPVISSPMRPYTDHPFVGNDGGQDLSAYIDSIIAHQDLDDLLLDPALANLDERSTVSAEPNRAAILMPSNTPNNKGLLENGWAKSESDKGADGIGFAPYSSEINILQMDTIDANHHRGAQTNLFYSGPAQVYNQYQVHSAISPEMEPPNSGALGSASSLIPYPSQNLFNNMGGPPQTVITNSDAFNVLEGWAAEPTTQQFAVPNFTDPQQGTAARRIRLLHSIQRASVTEPVLTSFESEDEAGSSYSTGSSLTNCDEDYANAISQTVAGEAMHIRGGGLTPTHVVSSVEVTEKLQDFSFDEDISPHGKLPRVANLKQRHKQENTKTSQNIREDLQHIDRVPGEPSLTRTRQPAAIGSVVQLLCLALVVILVFFGLWNLDYVISF
ncbi:hypothetical protein ACP70R_042079 [Stipagrostis hirtigluma subsp. patula]